MIWTSATHVNVDHCDTIHDWWLFRHAFKISWYDIRNHLHQYKNFDQLRHDLVTAAQGKIIVLDAASDPVPFDELCNTIVQAGLAEVAATLVNDRDQCHKNPKLNLRYFPKWILATMAKFHREDMQLPDSLWQRRSHQISCMNRLVRKHRFYAWYLLEQLPWFNQAYRSFGGFDCCPRHSIGEYLNLDDMVNVLPSDCFRWFKDNLHRYPWTSDSNFDWFNHQHDHLCPAFVDSYANIVTETSVEVFCPTEKTTKCLQVGTLMLPVASPGHLDKLALMGFEVNFDGIDYSYENIPDWQLRTRACVHQANIVHNDLEQIWHQNLPKMQYNQNLFKSLDLFYHCVQDIKDLIRI